MSRATSKCAFATGADITANGSIFGPILIAHVWAVISISKACFWQDIIPVAIATTVLILAFSVAQLDDTGTNEDPETDSLAWAVPQPSENGLRVASILDHTGINERDKALIWISQSVQSRHQHHLLCFKRFAHFHRKKKQRHTKSSVQSKEKHTLEASFISTTLWTLGTFPIIIVVFPLFLLRRRPLITSVLRLDVCNLDNDGIQCSNWFGSWPLLPSSLDTSSTSGTSISSIATTKEEASTVSLQRVSSYKPSSAKLLHTGASSKSSTGSPLKWTTAQHPCAAKEVI